MLGLTIRISSLLMPPRLVTSEGNVTRIHSASSADAPEADPRVELARYIGQMVLDLERMANTANLELLSYFLAMARAEADAIANVPAQAKPEREAQTQAPYRAE
jgi:hypothetical protein